MKIHRKQPNPNESGSAIILVVVLIGLLGLITSGFTQKFQHGLQSAVILRERNDLDTIRRLTIENISCVDTDIATYGFGKHIEMPEQEKCPTQGTNQVPPFLKLRRLTADGAKLLLGTSDQADGVYRVDKYYVRASCSQSENTIVLKAIPISGISKVTRRKIDWDSPEALLIGPTSGYIACHRPPPYTMNCSSGSACVVERPKIPTKE